MYNNSQFKGNDEEDTQRKVRGVYRIHSVREAAVGASRIRDSAVIYDFRAGVSRRLSDIG